MDIGTARHIDRYNDRQKGRQAGKQAGLLAGRHTIDVQLCTQNFSIGRQAYKLKTSLKVYTISKLMIVKLLRLTLVKQGTFTVINRSKT